MAPLAQFSPLSDAGLRVKLSVELGKALQFEEDAGKLHAERDHLWCELRAESKVSAENQAALEECRRQLGEARAKLQKFVVGAEEVCAILLLPPLEKGPNLASQLRTLTVHVPWALVSVIHRGASAALMLMGLWHPDVDLSLIMKGMPEKTSEKKLEETKEAVAPFVDTTAGVVDDRQLLADEYPNDDGAPAGPQVPPRPV